MTIDELRAILPGHVTIVSQLGAAGGQGTVFKGTYKGAGAAIKAFKVDADVDRVKREIDLLSKIACRHVVSLLGFCTVRSGADEIWVLAYELHEGGDLTQHVRAPAPPLTPQELTNIGFQVSTAIETLWSKRIVHRDIKPANIVRAADGRCVLVDVGFARHLDLSDLTAPGGAPGTRGFRSPEQAKGRRSLTIHSDVFSLGVTLYVLASKKHPFGNADLMAPPIGLDVAPLKAAGLSDSLIRLVAQMMDFIPAKRPLDAKARFGLLGGQ